MPWEGILALVGVCVTALVTWLTVRRNTASQEKQKQTDGYPAVIKGYESLLADTRESFEQRIQNIEKDYTRRALEWEDREKEKEGEFVDIKKELQELKDDKVHRDKVHEVSMRYIRDTFEGMRDGSVPPIIPVPDIIAAEFDGNLLQALLMTQVRKGE